MGHRLSLGNDTIRKLLMKEVTSVKSHRLIDEAALRKKARLKRLDTDRLSAQQRLHQRLGKKQEKHQVKLMAVGTVRKSDAKTPTEANVGSAVIVIPTKHEGESQLPGRVPPPAQPVEKTD